MLLQSWTCHLRAPTWRFGILSKDKKEHRAYDATDGHLPHERELLKVCWDVCDATLFCIAIDQLRPATDADSLAYQCLHGYERTSASWTGAIVH